MSLVLGPVLRHVGDATAAVWVQLDRPATVFVLGCSARTFEVVFAADRSAALGRPVRLDEPTAS